MSGLDKMKSRIFEEAEQSAAELLDQAKKDAEKIVKDAVEKAGADAEHIRVKAAADAKEYAKRAESSADMNRKQALLAAKQDVIRSVLEDAYSQVMNMDDAAYFEMLGKMLDKYMLAQDGAICFSKRDLDRMPKSFAEKIDASAKAKGGKLVISEEARSGYRKYGKLTVRFDCCTGRRAFGTRHRKHYAWRDGVLSSVYEELYSAVYADCPAV